MAKLKAGVKVKPGIKVKVVDSPKPRKKVSYPKYA